MTCCIRREIGKVHSFEPTLHLVYVAMCCTIINIQEDFSILCSHVHVEFRQHFFEYFIRHPCLFVSVVRYRKRINILDSPRFATICQKATPLETDFGRFPIDNVSGVSLCAFNGANLQMVCGSGDVGFTSRLIRSTLNFADGVALYFYFL